MFKFFSIFLKYSLILTTVYGIFGALVSLGIEDELEDYGGQDGAKDRA